MQCLQNPLRELHIATVAIHDDFDYTGLVNDIAILKTGIKRFLFPSILINGLNLFFFFSGTSEPVWFPPCLSSFQRAKLWWNGWNSGRWSYNIVQTTICLSSEGWGQTEELSNSDTLKDVEVDLIFVLQFLACYIFLQIRSSHNYNQYRTPPLIWAVPVDQLSFQPRFQLLVKVIARTKWRRMNTSSSRACSALEATGKAVAM